MKQKITTIVLLAGILLFTALPTYAQFSLVNCGRKEQTPCELNDIFVLGATIVSFLLWASSLVAILFIVIGGIRMIFSGGNSQLIQTGKQTLFNAVLGLLIVLASYLIINVVLTTLSGGSISLTDPTGFWRN